MNSQSQAQVLRSQGLHMSFDNEDVPLSWILVALFITVRYLHDPNQLSRFFITAKPILKILSYLLNLYWLFKHKFIY